MIEFSDEDIRALTNKVESDPRVDKNFSEFRNAIRESSKGDNHGTDGHCRSDEIGRL